MNGLRQCFIATCGYAAVELLAHPYRGRDVEACEYHARRVRELHRRQERTVKA